MSIHVAFTIPAVVLWVAIGYLAVGVLAVYPLAITAGRHCIVPARSWRRSMREATRWAFPIAAAAWPWLAYEVVAVRRRAAARRKHLALKTRDRTNGATS